MIEQEMIFALGFMLAGILALLFMPVLSRRAVRLATRRLSMLVPLSMTEVAAERDGLRAAHAAAIRMLEQAVDRLTREKADAMADAGRQSGRAAVLDAERAALSLRATTLKTERDDAVRAAHEAEAGFGAQVQVLHDAVGLAERRAALLNAARAEAAAGAALADGHRLTIAGLETRATGQDLRIRALAGQVATLTEDLRTARAAAAAAARARETARAEGALLTAHLALLQADLDGTRAETAALRARLDREASTQPRAGDPEDLAALRRTIASLAADLFAASGGDGPPPAAVSRGTETPPPPPTDRSGSARGAAP